MVDSFDDIFENDPDGILNVKPKASVQTGDERVRGKFEQVLEFFREKGRAPEPNQFDITEFQLYAQLKGIRENEELRMAMEPLDEYGLLGEPKAAPESIDDIFADDQFGGLLGGADEPNLFEFKHTPKELERAEADFVAQRKPMKDFVGLENVDENIRKAIMNFSHYLSVGNMDEAYNSVRNIKNQTVWQNMAQMCVKTKRIDVALVCLGNMRFARGAKAARETDNEKELDARLAMVAIQLNMLDDAKELYKSCGRYDLLCKLYPSCGEWDEAIAIAAKYNRINLKNTHY